MTSRAAGRHRRRLSAQRTQSLLLLEYPGGEGPPWVYLNNGIVPNGRRLYSPGPASANIRRGMGPGPVAGRRAIRAALVRDRRAFTIALSAGLVGVAAAVSLRQHRAAAFHLDDPRSARRGRRLAAPGLGPVVGRPAGQPVRAGHAERPGRVGHPV